MKKKLAPLALFVYNRLDLVVITLHHLQKNNLANETDLFIFSDGPKSEKDELDVQKVREYVNHLDGFKSVKVTERSKNYGLAKNILEGVSELLYEHKKIIVLEDDLITSNNFLCYMNEALDFYKENKKIFSISGYTMPLKSLKQYDQAVYCSLRPSSWGWATWLDQWEKVDWDVKDYSVFINNRRAIKEFNRGGIDLTRMLTYYKKGKNNSWAIRWAYAMYKSGNYSIYPKISKVENIGFGDNATHCSGMNIYTTNLDNSDTCDFEFIEEISIDNALLREFKFQYSYMNKIIKKTYKHWRRIID